MNSKIGSHIEWYVDIDMDITVDRYSSAHKALISDSTI